MLLNKFLNPCNDLVFKRIFGDKDNKDILIHFINDILDRPSPTVDVSFLKTVQDPEIAPFRVSIIDVICEDQDKNRFIIEMQVSHERGFDRRALYYAARAYCAQRTKDKAFHALKDVYFLAITNFTPFPNKTSWISRIGLKDLDTNEHDIEAIQLFFMQLPLFKKTKADLATMSLREKWAYFFKYAETTHEGEVENVVGKDPIIKRAYDELSRFAWSEKELNDYESAEMKLAADAAVKEAALEQGMKEGLEKGLKQGIEQGREKEKYSVARSCLEQGLSIEQISKVTGLSEVEIETLEKSIELSL